MLDPTLDIYNSISVSGTSIPETVTRDPQKTSSCCLNLMMIIYY